MTTPQHSISAHDVFWLARYAHNKTAPLFAQAQAIEPSLHFAIHVSFTEGHPVFKGNHIGIYSHWDRKGMFQYESLLTDKAGVDRFAAKLEGDVANLQPLEAGVSA